MGLIVITFYWIISNILKLSIGQCKSGRVRASTPSKVNWTVPLVTECVWRFIKVIWWACIESNRRRIQILISYSRANNYWVDFWNSHVDINVEVCIVVSRCIYPHSVLLFENNCWYRWGRKTIHDQAVIKSNLESVWRVNKPKNWLGRRECTKLGCSNVKNWAERGYVHW